MFRNSIFRSPRPDQDVEAAPAVPPTPASQTVSRFRFSGIRSMANGSSIYSQSPALTSANTPKMPAFSFLRRPHEPNLSDINDGSNDSSISSSPQLAQHSARSYIVSITPPPHVPQMPEPVYDRHPADVPLPSVNAPLSRQTSATDPETEQLAAEVHGQRRRRRRRRRHAQPTHWKRRQGQRSAFPYVKGTAARGKLIATALSGSFLLVVLAIYLAIALTNKNIGQEIHILFILVLLSITIFFCHSLIRLCMLILNPPREVERNFMPNMTAQEGFQPIVPIPVRLARDEELGHDSDSENDMTDSTDPEKEVLPPPPPAYGLWRSSVRVDPNLLHWQRVEERGSRATTTDSSRGSRTTSPRAPSVVASRNGSVIASDAHDTAAEEAPGPRPPSYASDDGVSYVPDTEPHSTVGTESHTGVSDIHPAWRPGWAMSEIRPNELPTGHR